MRDSNTEVQMTAILVAGFLLLSLIVFEYSCGSPEAMCIMGTGSHGPARIDCLNAIKKD
jgi:hypothetical protein